MNWYLKISAVVVGLVAASAVFGQVNIGGITYDKVDPGPEFTQRVQPAPDWSAPSPTFQESQSGFIVYVTNDPGDYKPDSRPRIREHSGALSAAITPGEQHVIWFGINAVRNLAGIDLKISQAGSVPVNIEARNIHFWPQRTAWSGRQWYMTPELLLPFGGGKKMVPAQRGVLREEAFNLDSGATAAFWLTLSADKNARPGKYAAYVTVSSNGNPALTLPISIEVLPFKLKEPADQRWLLYADAGRWNNMAESQVFKELQDFRSHGFTGLVELSLGTVDLTPLKQGKEPIFDASRYKYLSNLCRKANIAGPHVISMEPIPKLVAETLGLTVDLEKGDWPEAVKQGVTAVAKSALKATRGMVPWYYYGVDEPSGDNTYAIQDYQCWRAAGADTYATVISGEFLSKSTNYITSPCFVAPMLSNQEVVDLTRKQCEQAGALFTWYGTGCYVNPYPQEQFMYHNRYGAGLYFWKTKAVNAVAWTFCRPHEDVFNDFDGLAENRWEPKEQAFAYPLLLKPDDWSTYQGAIPTIAWESHREGWNDYLYLYTASSLISEKQKTGEISADKADKARAKLKAIEEEVPWANLLGDVAFDPAKLQKARDQAIDLIKDLDKK